MDSKTVKEKIKIAHEMVEGEVEPYKTAAFQVIFEKLLNLDQTGVSHSKTSSIKTSLDGMSVTENAHTIDLEKRKAELAKNCGITVKELGDVISIKNEIIQVIHPLTGKESNKQIVAAQCILVAYDVLFGKESVNSSLLSKCIDYSGIGALNHLAENLKEHASLFRASGKGRILDYRLTGPGRKSAYEKMGRLAGGDDDT